MKLVVTGSRGLLGWHTAARIHAQICAARFNGEVAPHELVQIDHKMFADTEAFAAALQDADAILHFAGVNRGNEDAVETANPQISRKLVSACQAVGANPHIIYANSTHSAHDTPYGRSKRIAGDILAEYSSKFTNMILPHIFGECAKPYYNNVTATLIDKIWKNEEPQINPDGRVQLLHSGAAAQIAIDAAVSGTTDTLKPTGQDVSVKNLYRKLIGFHEQYCANTFPDIKDPFDLALFNSLRAGGYPNHYPMLIKTNKDHRGVLFETAKGGSQSQSFMSSTFPGEKRGDHFHLDLIERFLVVKGKAVIRIRRVLTDEVQEFHVSGEKPEAIDMPPLHTHNIENLGDEDVMTFFWSHRLFDPSNPDTYADPV